MKLGWRLALVVVLQTAALVYMIGARQWTLATGTPVVLETVPIDPRSLFSGDYVRLGYRISRLDLSEIAGERNFRNHDVVYVTLRPGTPTWYPVSVCHDFPVVPQGDVAIRGEVTGITNGAWNPAARRWEEGSASVLSVRYGIESYFVPEGEGRELENPGRDAPVSVRVAVDHAGRAGIQAILVDGVVRYEERLF